MPTPANAIQAIAGRLTSAEASELTALVGQRSRPGKPTKDDLWPYVAFWQTEGDGAMGLKGRRRTQAYSIRVEVFAESQDLANQILDAAGEALANWSDRSIGVQVCYPQGDAGETTYDDGTQGFGQTYTLWFAPQ